MLSYEKGRILALFFTLIVALFFLSKNALSQEIDLEGYDPNTEIVVKGKVKEVVIPDHGMVSIVISRGNKLYRAYLCPRWYYFQLKPSLKPGDTVEIRGAKIYTRRQGLIFAVRVLKNLTSREEIILRDANCEPCWRGRRW